MDVSKEDTNAHVASHEGSDEAAMTTKQATEVGEPTLPSSAEPVEHVGAEPTPFDLGIRHQDLQAPQASHTVQQRVRGDEDVYDMLTMASARQKTFEAIRELQIEASLDIGVSDTRRCDYPLKPVPRVLSVRARRGGRASAECSSTSASEVIPPASCEASEADTATEGCGAFIWHRHLETHVVQLMMELRFKPNELKVFLAVQYPKRGDAAKGDSSDEDVEVNGSDDQDDHVRSTKVSNASTINDTTPVQMQQSLQSTYISVKNLHKKLTEIGVQLGEAIYNNIRRMLLKSVRVGLIDRSSNLIRLESMFKLELRRQVTIERLKHAALSRHEHCQNQIWRALKRREDRKRNTIAPNSGHGQGLETSPDVRLEAREWTDVELGTGMTAHQFKMDALERLLGSERKEAEVILRSEQFEDQVHEKVTSVIYSKSRECFPFWKDLPECGLTRDETTKLLYSVINALAHVPVFRSLGIDQLIEMAKFIRWKMQSRGDTMCVKDTSMNCLIIIMEGHVAAGTSDEPPLPSFPRSASILDDRRSVDASFENCNACFGEIGLFSKTELWPFSLFVKSPSTRSLVLTREAFDSALVKIFGGPKRQRVVKDISIGKRPASSPTTTRFQSLSAHRPTSSAIREHAIEKVQQHRDGFLRQVNESGTNLEDANSAEPLQKGDMSPGLSPRKRHSQSHSVYQHYPFFPVTTGVKAAPQTFRLKCIQPIAFGMKPIDDLIQDEWAPAFPDTRTLVDYMSTIDSSFLFDKRNGLIKSNLRAVCTNVPFHDDAPNKSRAEDYLSYYQDAQSDFFSEESSGHNPFGGPLEAAATITGPGGAGTLLIGDQMTLNQFADARRRIFGRLGASFGGAASPSMRNVLASTATSATLAKHGHSPFTRSSFVPESSFVDDFGQILRAQAEDDDTDADSSLPSGRRPEVDEDSEIDDERSASNITAERSASAGKLITDSSSTMARKMTFDSLMQGMSGGSPSKKQIMDQEAVRRVTLQKHLYAANQGPPATNEFSGTRKASLHGGSDSHLRVEEISSAPLPLRADLQRRIEAVLADLKMKPKAKLDLVLKYTHADHCNLFPDAVVLWEQALHYINKRETTLDTLRAFELVASDPRRHFRSLSTHRLAEQKERDALFYQLNYDSDLCRESLDELEKRCGDAVYLENRLYRDKMAKDYTELLFQVEQDRLHMIYKGVQSVVADRRQDSSTSRIYSNHQQDPIRTRNDLSQGVSGAGAAPTMPRYTLSTPRESIYTSVGDRGAQEEQEERVLSVLQATANAPPRRPVHKLSVQVQKHRQAQLDELTAKRGTTTIPTTTTPKPTATFTSGASQVRAASSVQPSQSSKPSSLKLALEQALGFRR